MYITQSCRIGLALFLIVCYSCKEKVRMPSAAAISALNLKKGAPVVCGPAESRLGTVAFAITATAESQQEFLPGLKLLHSFEYEEAEKVFASIIAKEPACYMAWWGIAMSNFHPLWTPPLPAELVKGAAAIAIANDLPVPSAREGAYMRAIAAFYKDYQTVAHRSRCLRFEQAMKDLQAIYPDDIEAKILYALALNAAADPADKTYGKQRQAGAILESLYKTHPDHPGVVHYLIHTWDAPETAIKGLEAARRYAVVAPSSAHALHMPSHVFTRLGLWQECITSNLASVSSAQCYAQATGIKGHWDEELHGLDYLVYAYLQRGDNKHALDQLHHLQSMQEVHPANFKVAYAMAAIPARMVMENRQWEAAASLQLPVSNVSWKDFPWQMSLLHFARAMGAIHTGDIPKALSSIYAIETLHDTLVKQKDDYKARQVQVQLWTARAWLWWKKGMSDSAKVWMERAATLEEQTGKHPVTPGELLPARELLGDLLMQQQKPAEALAAYEQNLLLRPNRFNALAGAAQAAQQLGDTVRVQQYYQQLLSIVGSTETDRTEVKQARRYLHH